MAIVVSSIRDAMVPVLGTAGTQRYLLQQQILPSINGGLRQFNAFVYSLLAERKGSEELLQEITVTRVFQTNAYGGITFSEAQLLHKVWSINAVYPEALLSPVSPTILALPDGTSQWRSDVTMQRPGRFRCTRITLEQLPDSIASKLMPGSEKLATSDMRSYAYCLIGDRSNAQFITNGVELLVLPESITGKKLVVVSYMKGVNDVTALTDIIPYPSSAFQLIRDLALNEISLRQGTKPLYNVTVDSVRALMKAQT